MLDTGGNDKGFKVLSFTLVRDVLCLLNFKLCGQVSPLEMFDG